ncbi:MAG TPA: transposase [Albitalea sp.]|uniref:REP-associated tyrosine transposase n=1 Tax=Piscinibacter sp. TaxID=1903157 RepID=UPI002ED1C5EE
MVLYRRNRVAGASYFFTVTLRDRHSDLLVRRVDDLRRAFRSARSERPFSLDAIVVLPEHLHTIWTLPDSDYPTRWYAIKSRFTQAVREAGEPARRSAKGEFDLWQRRYWEHTLRDDDDVARHMDYIHFNPVKHGAGRACDGLAALVVSSVCRARHLPADLGIGV